MLLIVTPSCLGIPMVYISYNPKINLWFCVMVNNGLVPDDTVHVVSNFPLFGTRGSLIFDTANASYSNTIFILFLCFIVQVKPRRETIQGAPPPHQTSGYVVNGNPSISASSHTRKGGYRKLLAVGSIEFNMGIFHSYFFVLSFPTRMPLTFSRPIPHGTDRLHMAPPPPRRRPLRTPGLVIGTLNILDVRGFVLAQAIQAVEHRGFDVMILTKTKISTTAYCQNRLG